MSIPYHCLAQEDFYVLAVYDCRHGSLFRSDIHDYVSAIDIQGSLIT